MNLLTPTRCFSCSYFLLSALLTLLFSRSSHIFFYFCPSYNPQMSSWQRQQSTFISMVHHRSDGVEGSSSSSALTGLRTSPSPLTLGFADAVPVAVAITETANAIFKGEQNFPRVSCERLISRSFVCWSRWSVHPMASDGCVGLSVRRHPSVALVSLSYGICQSR